MRIVVLELCNPFHRIAAILREPSLRRGAVVLPRGPAGYDLENFHAVSSFQHACSAYMQQMQTDNPHLRTLDLRMAVQAFRAGSLWAIRNACNEKRA